MVNMVIMHGFCHPIIDSYVDIRHRKLFICRPGAYDWVSIIHSDYDYISIIPSNTRPNNNAIFKSKRRRDVVVT